MLKSKNNTNINVDILSFLYNMINLYYNSNNSNHIVKKHIIDYIEYYKIPIAILEKFLKFFH